MVSFTLIALSGLASVVAATVPGAVPDTAPFGKLLHDRQYVPPPLGVSKRDVIKPGVLVEVGTGGFTPLKTDGSKLLTLREIERRQTCRPGTFVCDTVCCYTGMVCCTGYDGCCDKGYYCAKDDHGTMGCCPNGKVCSGTVPNNDPQCQDPGYELCPSKDFCCPNASMCARDSFGNPACGVTCQDPTYELCPSGEFCCPKASQCMRYTDTNQPFCDTGTSTILPPSSSRRTTRTSAFVTTSTEDAFTSVPVLTPTTTKKTTSTEDSTTSTSTRSRTTTNRQSVTPQSTATNAAHRLNAAGAIGALGGAVAFALL